MYLPHISPKKYSRTFGIIATVVFAVWLCVGLASLTYIGWTGEVLGYIAWACLCLLLFMLLFLPFYDEFYWVFGDDHNYWTIEDNRVTRPSPGLWSKSKLFEVPPRVTVYMNIPQPWRGLGAFYHVRYTVTFVNWYQELCRIKAQGANSVKEFIRGQLSSSSPFTVRLVEPEPVR